MTSNLRCQTGISENGERINIHELTTIPKYIHIIRDVPVMLDSDLAMMYGIETKNLNKAVNRNQGRLPDDFMFQLTRDEWEVLRFQIGTFNKTIIRKYTPYVFTEPGVAMLSSVLNSSTAINVNISIIRTFIKMRNTLATVQDKSKEITELRKLFMLHIDRTDMKLSKHDEQLRDIATALNAFLAEPPKPKRRIGFRPPGED